LKAAALRHEHYHRFACNYFNNAFHMVGENTFGDDT